jgi:hypothetical protein
MIATRGYHDQERAGPWRYQGVSDVRGDLAVGPAELSGLRG